MVCYRHIPRCCGIYYYFCPYAVTNPISPFDATRTPSWLPQVSLLTDAKLYDSSSRTKLIQTFVNPSKKDEIEHAKYNFPLYESCAVVAFRCFVAGRLIEGVVKEKIEAKVEYDAAVARGETAGLLEQFTPDVFRTSLGNIPAGATVKVEIEYIMELKHDAGVDGLRFTIPTSIAPRYGGAPTGLGTYTDDMPIREAYGKGGMKISVKITMPSNIRAVQSPTHPIAMHLGGHTEDDADDAFNPKHALATLSQTSTELGSDFVVLVKCADLSSPRALLETHPTKPNSKALMVTLVPKFTLPSGPKPEIVFIVDRSGSMNGRMEPLKSSLSVFLKSLPVGIRFNICSFGSRHSFLWKKSQPYSANTLEKAQSLVQSMTADMGGTEILPPIKATVSKRYKDLPLEIMVLTDGEAWNTEPLFEFIEKETATGDIRVFSLGIGRDVSHALVEGLARTGRGFAQILSNEKEGMEGKVVRMLKGGLSAHVKDYRLEWEGRPLEQDTLKPTKGKAVQRVPKRKINLFDAKADTDAPIASSKSGADRFSHLPEVVVPTVLQTPYKLPPLFPFSRFTVYAILTGDSPPPSSVWLRGTAPSGDELELEIPVQALPEKAHTVHQLAGRKLLQELEEGTGYLHSGKYGIDKEENPGTFEDWVDREGTRVGVEYGLASKWTSFVAVKKKQSSSANVQDLHDLAILDSDYAMEEVDEEVDEDDVDHFIEVDSSDNDSTGPVILTKAARSSQPLARQALGGLGSSRTKSSSRKKRSRITSGRSIGGTSASGAARSRSRGRPNIVDMGFLDCEAEVEDDLCDVDQEMDPLTRRHRVQALIALQSFDGSFSLTKQLASALGASLTDLEAKLMECPLEINIPNKQKEKLWATVLAVVMFEKKLSGEKGMWDLVVVKARDWISGLTSVGEEDLNALEMLASEVLVA